MPPAESGLADARRASAQECPSGLPAVEFGIEPAQDAGIRSRCQPRRADHLGSGRRGCSHRGHRGGRPDRHRAATTAPAAGWRCPGAPRARRPPARAATGRVVSGRSSFAIIMPGRSGTSAAMHRGLLEPVGRDGGEDRTDGELREARTPAWSARPTEAAKPRSASTTASAGSTSASVASRSMRSSARARRHAALVRRPVAPRTERSGGRRRRDGSPRQSSSNAVPEIAATPSR